MTDMGARQDVERWLAAERAALEGGALEGSADSAFARVFAAVPRVEPGAGFAERVARTAWKARVRRRRFVRAGRRAASLAAVFIGAGATYVAVVEGGAWVVRTAAAVTVRGVSLVVRSAAEGLDWWSILVRVGRATGEVLVTPQVSTAVIAVEILGALALYALSRLLRDDRNNAERWEART